MALNYLTFTLEFISSEAATLDAIARPL